MGLSDCKSRTWKVGGPIWKKKEKMMEEKNEDKVEQEDNYGSKGGIGAIETEGEMRW